MQWEKKKKEIEKGNQIENGRLLLQNNHDNHS